MLPNPEILSHVSNVVIEDTEVDLYAAIDRASYRAGRTIAHRLACQRARCFTNVASTNDAA